MADQPAEKIKLEEVENKANDQVGKQVTYAMLSLQCSMPITELILYSSNHRQRMFFNKRA